MTAHRRPERRRQLRLLPGSERELIQRLFDELFRYSTTDGHRAMANHRESRGECSWRQCAASCQRFHGVMDDAHAYLMSGATEAPAAGRRVG